MNILLALSILVLNSLSDIFTLNDKGYKPTITQIGQGNVIIEKVPWSLRVHGSGARVSHLVLVLHRHNIIFCL